MLNETRRYIMNYFIATGRAPTRAQAASNLALSLATVTDIFITLAAEHIIVLQNNSEILMALPFSAVPTTFNIVIEGKQYWGNCIWDALGIPAMLQQNAEIITACGCCNYRLTINITNQQLDDNQGVVHFALPLRKWWDNIVYT